MKILYIHNEYAKPSGEEHASGELAALLEEHGHEVSWFKRSSSEVADTKTGAVKAFFAGVYNPHSRRVLSEMLDRFDPDIVQVQNLYPLISCSIFDTLKKRDIPVVMRCPNYRLFCPSGLCLAPDGSICEACFSGGKEFSCIRKNCLHDSFKSLGYATRNAFSRSTRKILDGVDVFIVQSEFQKNKFIWQGIPAERIGILSGISPAIAEAPSTIGEWVGFVGRVSVEKGIYEFIEASKLFPDIPFKVAGNLDEKFIMPKTLPSNIEFVGFKKGEDLNEFYRKCRIIVVPSKWYEGFPNVILRAFMLHRPVITTNIGAMDSIVDHSVNGLKIDPGNASALANAIDELYPDPERCLNMGINGRRKTLDQYSRDAVYKQLLAIYMQAKNIRSK